jgi:hypothetical protein
MELSKVITARSVWLFDLDELNPRGRRVEPIFETIKARYHFAEAALDEKKSGYIFKKGRWGSGQSELDIDSLEIFNDGVVVNTRSDTADSDAVLEDAFSWLWVEYGLGSEDFSTKPRKQYISELVVRSPGANLDKGLGILLTIKDSIAQAIGMAAPLIETQAVVFGSSDKRNLFTFERRIGEPFSSAKYFSTAAMRTADHLELLAKVTSLL